MREFTELTQIKSPMVLKPQERIVRIVVLFTVEGSVRIAVSFTEIHIVAIMVHTIRPVFGIQLQWWGWWGCWPFDAHGVVAAGHLAPQVVRSVVAWRLTYG